MTSIITITLAPMMALGISAVYVILAVINPWRKYGEKASRSRRLASLTVGVLLGTIVLGLWHDRMIEIKSPAGGEAGHVEFRLLPRLVHYYDSCPGRGPC